jgi:hypothetical protein
MDKNAGPGRLTATPIFHQLAGTADANTPGGTTIEIPVVARVYDIIDVMFLKVEQNSGSPIFPKIGPKPENHWLGRCILLREYR